MARHRFGGSWTERKLTALREYLVQYQKIFTTNVRAKELKTIYVDAFAGTGERSADIPEGESQLFGYDEEIRSFQEGSVRRALSLPSKFHQYIFIDNKAKHVNALRELVKQEFAELSTRCIVEKTDANEWLQAWCKGQDWRMQRAVVFLDPYGMDVEWKTIEAIAKTQAIDLWLLFPLGIGPSRVMPNQQIPEAKWADRLTKLFGSEEWKARFYRTDDAGLDLFGVKQDSTTKIAGVDEILTYFLGRLKAIFERIVEQPLILKNSKHSPMYALCFAAGNKKGAPTAVKIAAHLVRD